MTNAITFFIYLQLLEPTRTNNNSNWSGRDVIGTISQWHIYYLFSVHCLSIVRLSKSGIFVFILSSDKYVTLKKLKIKPSFSYRMRQQSRANKKKKMS